MAEFNLKAPCTRKRCLLENCHELPDIYKKLPNGPASAKSLLWNKPAGTFLVRQSSSQVSDYALDVKVSSGTVHHIRIKTRWLKHGKSFAIISQRPEAEKEFLSLDALLAYLSEEKYPWLPLVLSRRMLPSLSEDSGFYLFIKYSSEHKLKTKSKKSRSRIHNMISAPLFQEC